MLFHGVHPVVCTCSTWGLCRQCSVPWGAPCTWWYMGAMQAVLCSMGCTWYMGAMQAVLCSMGCILYLVVHGGYAGSAVP